MTTVRQLVDKLGTSENVLAGNPKMTYMKTDYSKTNRYTNQIITMQFPKDVYYGTETVIDLYQEGDIINAAWLVITYPSNQPTTVCDSFGTYVINWAQLECGNQVIERLHGEYIEIFNDITVPQGKQGALSNLIGKNLTTNLSSYYVKLPFSAFKYGIPICALDENLSIRFNLRNFYECVTGATLNPLFNAVLLVDYIFLEEKEKEYYKKNTLDYLVGENQYFSTQCNVPVSQLQARDFSLAKIYLDTAGVTDFIMPSFTNKVISVTLAWVFTTSATPANINNLTLTVNGTTVTPVSSSIIGTTTTVNYTLLSGINTVSNNRVIYLWPGTTVTSSTLKIDGSYIGGGSLQYPVKTEFYGPCKELFVVLQHTSAQPYDYTLNGNNLLSSMAISLDGVEYLKAATGTPMLLQTLHGLDRHVRVPDRKFYMYSFCIDPENRQPSGVINMGMIKNQQYYFSLNCSGNPINIRMYMRSYNVMKIQDGKLNMMYKIPQDAKGSLISPIPSTPMNLQFSGTYTTTTDGGYTIVKFTAGTGYVNVISGGTVDILIVGGGGGSGSSQAKCNSIYPTTGSFGGGGGGVLYVKSYNLVPGYYQVTVGAGGLAGPYGSIVIPISNITYDLFNGGNGGNSSFGSLVAYGGGGGGCEPVPTWGNNFNLSFGGLPGISGGSGGAGYNKAGSGTPGQGNTGSTSMVSGGGGGAGGTGDSNPLTGGPGIANSITGTVQYYGGGGGTATDSTIVPQTILGGIGGGGNGARWNDTAKTYTAGTAGTDGTGGGGGGGAGNASQTAQILWAGLAGGSGVVIIRY